MANMKTTADAALRKLLGTLCLTKATLAINAGGAATVKTTGTTSYLVGGEFKTKAALAAQSIAVTHDEDGIAVANGIAAYVQPVSTTVIYVIALNAAGTVAVVQGSYAGQVQSYAGNLSRINTGAGGAPVEPEGYTAIGAIKVVTNGSTTFTPGTTLLDAAGLTVTYHDVSILPAAL
jgi:hypothetical protein